MPFTGPPELPGTLNERGSCEPAGEKEGPLLEPLEDDSDTGEGWGE